MHVFMMGTYYFILKKFPQQGMHFLAQRIEFEISILIHIADHTL